MPLNSSQSLKNHLLIAMPAMEDPRFAQTITYICEHNADGAMGLVVNQPLSLSKGDIFDHMKIDSYAICFNDCPVLGGGPLQTERGFVLHNSERPWGSTLKVEDGIYITTSKDILHAIAEGNGPQKNDIVLGYAGWQSGQLEDELAQNTWLNVEANPNIIFSTPYEQRWQAAASLLGVDLSLLSTDVGHA